MQTIGDCQSQDEDNKFQKKKIKIKLNIINLGLKCEQDWLINRLNCRLCDLLYGW